MGYLPERLVEWTSEVVPVTEDVQIALSVLVQLSEKPSLTQEVRNQIAACIIVLHKDIMRLEKAVEDLSKENKDAS